MNREDYHWFLKLSVVMFIVWIVLFESLGVSVAIYIDGYGWQHAAFWAGIAGVGMGAFQTFLVWLQIRFL